MERYAMRGKREKKEILFGVQKQEIYEEIDRTVAVGDILWVKVIGESRGRYSDVAVKVVDIFRDYVSAETSHGMRVSIPKVDIYYGFGTIMML
jgi:hypothetical protein